MYGKALAGLGQNHDRDYANDSDPLLVWTQGTKISSVSLLPAQRSSEVLPKLLLFCAVHEVSLLAWCDRVVCKPE